MKYSLASGRGTQIKNVPCNTELGQNCLCGTSSVQLPVTTISKFIVSAKFQLNQTA